MESAVVLPPGVERPQISSDRAMIVNETALPDEIIETYIEENASVLGVNQGTSFQTYANEGSMLARTKFRTPSSIVEEICLSRDMAEKDDDVGPAVGALVAVAAEGGMQNMHEDEVSVAIYNKVAKHAGLLQVFKEMYRELLIASQVSTAMTFSREKFSFTPEGADQQRTRGIAAPRVGVIPSEHIRIVGSDLFGTGVLAYKPPTGSQERWLAEFFAKETSAARKAEMRREDPVMTSLLVEELDEMDTMPESWTGEISDVPTGLKLYRLNPRLVHRSTFPKGAWSYPRPLMTRNFPMLEAKRLLNIMDYAFLQGGSNYIVVAKKGSDAIPAKGPEIENLHGVMKRASRTGVVIGDHRLSIEVITPDLKELLSPARRQLVGRKLANAILRVPEADEDAGGEGMKARTELITRIISDDRQMLRHHIEDSIYEEVAERNRSSIPKGPAYLWFGKIVLQGTQYFTDYILKSRDRGDISRRSAVEAAGFDYDAEVQRRRREKARGDDKVMTPGKVPFSSNEAGPQDNQEGRPPGARDGSGDGAKPRRRIAQNAGETVTARYDEENGTYRVGELTEAVLEEYGVTDFGRLTPFEQQILDRIGQGEWDQLTEGPLTAIPVNPEYGIEDVRAVRLATGVSMLLGRDDEHGALMARALIFREPSYGPLEAQETALRWGYAGPRQEEP